MAEKIRLEDRECPLSATLGLVGEWWTLLILHDAFDGYTRFDQFQENLGISSASSPAASSDLSPTDCSSVASTRAPAAPRVRPHRPRSLAAPGHRRARGLGQRSPRTAHAAWCSSTPKPATKPSPSSSTACPVDASTDPTSSSPPGPRRANRFATVTKAVLVRALRRVGAASPARRASGASASHSEGISADVLGHRPEFPAVVGRVRAPPMRRSPGIASSEPMAAHHWGLNSLRSSAKNVCRSRGDRVDLAPPALATFATSADLRSASHAR